MQRLVLTLFLALSPLVHSDTITLATLNWEPFYGEDLRENGFFSALAREAFERAGHDMELEFLPWKRALEMARRGKFDGLLGAYYNKDRANTFYFSDPVAQNEEVFVQKKGRGITYNELEELKRYKIGGLRGGAQVAELREMGFDVQTTSTDAISLKKLKNDRLDLHIVGRQQLYYKLQNSDDFSGLKGEFEVVEPPFKSYDLYVTITKKHPDGKAIIEEFNKALASMREDGTYQKILDRFGQK